MYGTTLFKTGAAMLGCYIGGVLGTIVFYLVAAAICFPIEVRRYR
jgi:hypothetical protein